MVTLAMLSSALIGLTPPQFPQCDQRRLVMVGWHDEMDARSSWGPLDMQNKAFVAVPEKGTMFLGLDRVPPNWPYSYQWSGVTRDVNVDVARYPVLMARVTQVQGYAHLDVDVLGANGAVVNTLRTSTLNAPGLSTLDLGASLSPGTYRSRLRLIVGGPNEGCCATYDWARFVHKQDVDFLNQHPDWSLLRVDGFTTR